MNKDAPMIESVMEMVGQFTAELMTSIPGWQKRLRECPEELATIEQEVHTAAAQGADMVVAGLISVTLREAAVQKKREASRKAFSYRLDRGRERSVRVRLLGGLVIWVCSIYCQAKRRSGNKEQEEKRPGVYLGAAQLGIGSGVSPGLLSHVSRQVALCPSIDFAHEELTRRGIEIDIKAVRRIAYQCGEKQLRYRRVLLDQWRAGELPAGDELAGKHVTAQIDGGRTKIRGELRAAPKQSASVDEDGVMREDAPGRSRTRPKKTYDADWREPKLLTIFVHDDQGKMVKEYRSTIDGTFQGPDAAAELLAMHLHRLGASQAASVTFCADGAPWIWDRIPTICKLVKLQDVPVHEVLDNCHAAHHISLALSALGLRDKQRMPLYRELRSRLRNGQWRQVVAELRELAEAEDQDSQFHTELSYLEKHGEAGRLNYRRFRQLGIPLGSGAIESGIRRVINQRLKSNSVSWRENNAEAMLQIRAQVVSKRWDERLAAIRKMACRDARTEWTWEPRPMSVKAEANQPTNV